MTTQMNPTDAEIAGKLDGMEAGCVRLKNNPGMSNGMWLTITDIETREKTTRLFLPSDLITLCRGVMSKVDGPAKPTDIERIIYALELWMKRIENGIPLPLEDHLRISGWQTRWSRMKKVIEDWKTKGEMPK